MSRLSRRFNLAHELLRIEIRSEERIGAVFRQANRAGERAPRVADQHRRRRVDTLKLGQQLVRGAIRQREAGDYRAVERLTHCAAALDPARNGIHRQRLDAIERFPNLRLVLGRHPEDLRVHKLHAHPSAGSGKAIVDIFAYHCSYTLQYE